MSFPEHRQALVDAVFDELGEDARWGDGDDAPVVRVRRAERDDDQAFGDFAGIVRARWLRVRRSEVADPAQGTLVRLVDTDGAPTGDQYRVSGEPLLGRNGVWTMPVAVA